MDIKNSSVIDLINLIKKITKLNQEQIAEKADISRPHLSAAKKSNSEGVRLKLLNAFNEDIERNLPLIEDPDVLYLKRNKEKEQDAMIDVLIAEVAKLRATVYKIPLDVAIDELKQNAKVSLKRFE